MVKAVFTTKVNPTYDDLPTFRYHFPRTYLNQARAAVGDWIVYYEPRRSSGDEDSRGGRQAYFATARVTTIEPDEVRPDHFYAFVTDYLDFDLPVTFKAGSHYFESALQREDGETNKGAFGRAVRSLPEREFDSILRAGFAPVLSPARPDFVVPGLAEEQEAFERPIIERVTKRSFRDAAFAAAVKTAYDDTCAVTGLRLINGGGRAEVQAAHIRPVASQGPDTVRNGIALSGTIHWMFDRGLISISEDYSILTADRLLPAGARGVLTLARSLRLPARPEWRPHPQFLKHHREYVFKG
ncbi:HNH endonuclease [Paracraurococcus lichenis]|uniref:HNH endonuclease n=1 Tax=Paracraurococcus lichenis TaxID=3064888 RepID=A0ABT9DWF2_9PROT|nr:HNH endonuclease [Paracraurococcus sp. LOR1-02]MDO9708227.1 HNH endonuclease [Paracraurococcus sp. LOR1-02]